MRLWFIDLDDSVFEASAGMLHTIHLKMNEFMVRELNLSWNDASLLRAKYWKEYGATFCGLYKHHNVDPEEFLTETHDFDPAEFVRYIGRPDLDIRCLSGKKILYTNGPRIYASRVLKLLGMTEVFNDVVTSTDMKLHMQWRPKPDKGMLRNLCKLHGVTPAQAILVDDSLQNLKAAKEVGLKTVWCTGYRRSHGKLKGRCKPLYVDFSVSHIRELVRLPV